MLLRLRGKVRRPQRQPQGAENASEAMGTRGRRIVGRWWQPGGSSSGYGERRRRGGPRVKLRVGIRR